MSNWKEYRFSDFVSINPSVKLKKGEVYSFVEMKDLNDGQKFCEPNAERELGGGARFQTGDTLFARITPCLENGKICQVKKLKNNVGFGSTEFHVFRGKDDISDTDFVFYLSRWDEVRGFAEMNFDGTSGRQRVPKESFDNLYLNLPPLPEQKIIASLLSSLDEKIDLLHRNNESLEHLAETLFKQWFQEDQNEWEEKPIDKIADFLNGLACQKFPHRSGPYLPVIKIKELRTGFTAATDKATISVPEKYVVENGDILFSWSGSLEVVIWPFGKGILNQHLFKVTSDKYPKWFYYLWCKYHLTEFRQIAVDKATTMGHIQRHHLSEATVVIPPPDVFKKMDKIIAPLIEKIISNNTQMQNLELLRDTYLSKLMSGEAKVKM